MGAIVDPHQLKRITDYVAKGIAEGATCWQPSYSLPAKGLFYPPTLLTNVQTSSTVVQEEIFGPVLVAMTFRTPAEAVELANNTVYGLASTVFSENINVALDVASQIKAGVCWVNCANMFDASCGFGGYRESGYGREGGREGMYEYLVPEWLHHGKGKKVKLAAAAGPVADAHESTPAPIPIDRTIKQYIGGKQARPDSGYSYPVYARDGKLIGEAPLGNRKDIRNAVEAARAAAKWAKQSAHNRAQVIFYIAENMIQRRDELAAKLAILVGDDQAGIEVDYSIERIFAYAGWADKFEGVVHNPPGRNVTLAMNEPVGTIGILAPEESPLLGLLSLVLPAIAMGNTVVAVPSERYATVMADLYSIFDTSDLPGGVVNIVAGRAAEIGKTLADHDDIDAIWSFRDEAASTMVKLASVGNMKQTWTNDGYAIDWYDSQQAEGRYFLRHATQIKNIWVPYGE
jgi:aldehyde dehydrogenase (NAD+)